MGELGLSQFLDGFHFGAGGEGRGKARKEAQYQ